MTLSGFLGVVVTLLGLIAWGGQTLVCLAPAWATRWRLNDRPEDCDPAFYADEQGQAVWDALTLWILPVAGLLYLGQSAGWPYWGLPAGAIYVYFGGAGIAKRLAQQRGQIRIGSRAMIVLSYASLGVWMVAGGLALAASLQALLTRGGS